MKKQNSFVSIGIVSLFLIFTVFCMVILCLLTYNTSSSDLISSKQSMNQTTAYYEACTQVTELVLKLNQKISEISDTCSDQKDFYSQVENSFLSFSDEVSFNSENNLFTIVHSYSDTQAICAEFVLLYPSVENAFLCAKSWNSIIIGEWTPDLRQNVYSGRSE